MNESVTYKTPEAVHRFEEVVKKSKFIVTIAHVPNEKAAKVFVSSMKKEFSNASHNCWAYVAGPPGDTAQIGMSDDGEPHGTAGKPILTVLLHCGIGEIGAVVTRYFGGTKLGTGGLARAYSGSVKNALQDLRVTTKRELKTYTITIKYNNIKPVKKLFESYGAEIVQENYEADVVYKIKIPKEQITPFLNSITDLTGGTALVNDHP